jgi:hypothetical protein
MSPELDVSLDLRRFRYIRPVESLFQSKEKVC